MAFRLGGERGRKAASAAVVLSHLALMIMCTCHTLADESVATPAQPYDKSATTSEGLMHVDAKPTAHAVSIQDDDLGDDAGVGVSAPSRVSGTCTVYSSWGTLTTAWTDRTYRLRVLGSYTTSGWHYLVK